MKVKIVYFSLF